MAGKFEIRSGLLARNIILNLAGMSVPLFVGVITIPILVRGLGIERFGALILTWTVVGYMGLLDFGLGRALTQLVAERLGRGQFESVPSLVWTSLILIFALGTAGGGILVLISPFLIHSVLKIPAALQAETLKASYIVAISIPFVLDVTGLRGVLEAFQRFGLSNAIRIPTGAFSFLGPLLVLHFSHSLVPMVSVIVAGRVVSWLVYLGACFRVLPELLLKMEFNPSELKTLLSFGGWVTVSNIIGPVMMYFDRFLIGAVISLAAVAYYATPFDAVTKVGVVAVAMSGVLYPAFATFYASDRAKSALLLEKGTKYLFIMVFPIIVLIEGFAHNGLAFWLGEGFAKHGDRVLQWLAIGVFMNSLVQIPYGLIQGAGRPDITAKLHLVELPFYLLTVWWLVHAGGVEGVAVAWTARVTVDTLMLFIIALRLLPRDAVRLTRGVKSLGLWLFLLPAVAYLGHELVVRALIVLSIIICFMFSAWLLILSGEERILFRGRLRGVTSLVQPSGERL